MSILLESYVGKTSNIKAAEKELSYIVNDIHRHYKKYYNSKSTKSPIYTNDSHLKKCEEYLAKEFNVSSVHLNIGIINVLGGPCTIPTAFRFLNRKNKNGKIDISDMDVYVYMDISTIAIYKLTTAETMAIILHEIGHNLDFTVTSKLKTALYTIITSGIFPITSEFMRVGSDSVNKIVDKLFINPVTRKIIVQINNMMSEINSYLRLWSVSNPVQLATDIQNFFLQAGYLGYYAERHSDSISAKYGYGSALASALNKITPATAKSNVNTVIRTNPITGLGYDLIDATNQVLHVFMAPHPANINRFKNVVAKLERDYKDPSLPKELKKEIEKELKELNTIIKTLENPSLRIGKYNIFTALSNRILSGIGKTGNRNILDFLYKAEKYEA